MLDLKQRSDARAVRQVLTGRRDAFDPLVIRYQSLVYHVALSHVGNPADAEDLAQDAFLKAFRALDTLQEPERFGPWVVTIVRNAARDFLKRQGVRASYVQSAGEPAPQEPDIEHRETRRVLWRHLEQLEEAQRELLVLHYFEGKRTKDLAALYGISDAACAKRLQRARQTLAAEVLNSLGIAADREERRDVRKQVMAGIAVLPVAWDARAIAAAKATGSLLGWGATKTAIGLTVTAGLALGSVAFLYTQAFRPTSNEIGLGVAVPGAASPETVAAMPENATALEPDGMASEVDPNSGRRFDPNNLGIGEISGVVLDASGQPVPGVEVVIDGMKDNTWRYPDEAEARRTQRTDDLGNFLFEQLPAPSHNIATTYVVMAFSGDQAAVATTHLTSSGYPREVTLKLQPARALTGIVVDSAGAPVAGARVYPVRTAVEEADEISRGVALRTTSDANGRFKLRGLTEEPWELVAMAEGHASQRTPLFAPGVDGIEIALSKGESMRGAVRDRDSGSPAHGVHILVHDAPNDGSISFSPWNTRLLETGEDGFYTAEHLLPGRYRTSLATLVEDTYVYPPGDLAKVLLEFSEAASEAPPLEVIRGGTLGGRVYDPATGEGLEAVQVTVLIDGTVAPAPAWTVTQTDPDGRYHFQGLRDGTHMVFLEQQRRDARTITTAPGEVVENIDFAHINAAWIAGSVLDADDHAVPGAVVEIGTHMPFGNLNIRSDARGRFEIRGLPPMGGLKLRARVPRYQSAVNGPYTITRDGVRDVVLKLDMTRTASASGIVVDGAGRPIVGAQVMAAPPEDFLNLGDSRETDAEGRFELSRLTAGRYSLQVVPKGQSTWTHGGDDFHLDLSEGERKEGIRLVHKQSNLTISGRVVDGNGQPIPVARLFLAGPTATSATSGKDGRFTVKNLEPGDYIIQVSHETFASSDPIATTAGAENVEIVLAAHARIAGRVVRADTGAPIEDFALAIREGEAVYFPIELTRGLSQQAERFRSNDGSFEVGGVKAGPTTVLAFAKGFAPGLTSLEEVPAGGIRRDVVVRLVPGLTVRGRVSNEEGAPVSGAAIYAGSVHSSGLDRSQSGAVTAPDGTFILDSLPENVRVVSVVHPAYAATVAPMAWRNGTYTPLDIHLNRGGVVEGTVVVDGAPPAQGMASVRVEYPGEVDSVSEQAQVNTDGTYRIENIRAGAAQVSASYRGTITSRTELRAITEAPIQAGEVTQADFQLSTGTAAIEGHVTDPNERTLGHAVLVQVDTAHQRFHVNAYLDRDRNYRAENLPAGRVTVQYPPNKPRQQFTLELQDGESLQRDFEVLAGGTIAYEVAHQDPHRSARVLLLPDAPSIVDINYAALQALTERALDVGPRMDFVWRMTFRSLEPGTYTVVAVSAVAWTETGLDAARVTSRIVTLDGTEEVFVPFQF